jgi:hypothetical protein
MKNLARRAFVVTTLALSMAIPTISAGPAAMAASLDRSPFYVNEVDVLYLESFPVQVQLLVRGSVPTPCHEPAWSVSDDGSFVSVELWSEADPDVLCAAVLQEVEVAIPVGEYERAQRAVLVNDRLTELISVGRPDASGTRLVAAGWSYGMCAGYCRADLIVIGQRLYMQGSDNRPDEPIFVNLGTLTDVGAVQLSAALASVDPASLKDIYGCPDCADGGAAYVGLIAAGQGSRHDMPFGDPPVELAELYELTQSFIGTLEGCRSDRFVTVDADCVPYEGR